jgi:hypothetical protein
MQVIFYGLLMQEIGEQALTVNLVFGTLVFGTVARLYVLPRISHWRPETVLVPILLLHSQRHLGLMFLAGGAVFPGMPSQFAWPAAIGDLSCAAAHGGSLLDSRVLGSESVSDSLRGLSNSGWRRARERHRS